MNYEDLEHKVKEAIAKLCHKEYFYGCKQYGESIYTFGDVELTIVRERTYTKEINIFTLTSQEFIIEYTSGIYDRNYGRCGNSCWESRYGNPCWEKYENLETLGDLEALDRLLIWLTLASSEE